MARRSAKATDSSAGPSTKPEQRMTRGLKRGQTPTSAATTTPKKARTRRNSDGDKSTGSVPNMRVFLPKELLDRMTSSQSAEEWKRYLRWLVAIIFFKVRGIPENYIDPILACCLPVNLSHLAEELLKELKHLNTQLTSIIIGRHRHFSDTLVTAFGDEKVQAARALAQAHRLKKTAIPRPFVDKASVMEHFTLSARDVIELWSSVLCFVHSDYMDNPSKFCEQWLHNLEESSYHIICRIASGIVITCRQYSHKAMEVDFHSTSAPEISFKWPEFVIPFSHTSISTRWGVPLDCWPRPVGSSLNDEASGKATELDSGDDFSDDIGSDDGIGCESMENVCGIHEADELKDRELANYFDTPGLKITYQYDPEYITPESSRLAQLNTSGITAYALERLTARAQSLKHFLVVASDRLEEAQEALRIVQEDEARNKTIEAKYKRLMSEVTSVEAEVRTRRIAVEKDRKLYMTADTSVRAGTARRSAGGGLSSMIAARRGDSKSSGLEGKRSGSDTRQSLESRHLSSSSWDRASSPSLRLQSSATSTLVNHRDRPLPNGFGYERTQTGIRQHGQDKPSFPATSMSTPNIPADDNHPDDQGLFGENNNDLYAAPSEAMVLKAGGRSISIDSEDELVEDPTGKMSE